MHDTGRAGALGELSEFRERFYQCLTGRADALFELADAVLCADGPVTSLAELSLTPEHRRGHGAGYDAINQGRIELDRLRTTLAGLPIPRAANGRIALAVDVSPCEVSKASHKALTCASGCCGFVLVDQSAEDWSATYRCVVRLRDWAVWSWWYELSGSVGSAVVVVGDVPLQH